ncbi:CDP-alcohol phosphatidyltransferase family protein [Ornithinimicrobium humiphilum]|uniref:CDP-diacylglycerol-phosphatidylglycerol phosphatidyltransferase n=1 Tax=Ornithinimicrobium humiphilum TaxID=125288 RepID=A0A543KNW1_9MICO|nr:CDP-alcohol phosphatidyltransferase family protein [Ornithinimicrobium humiphilum]TQM96767.1 CDP-diacylglycerol-phosphatidylglycerol phosphatidyltransferase [Ornithinimicrobium humiphilum]
MTTGTGEAPQTRRDDPVPSVSARVLTVPNVLSVIRLVGVPVYLWLLVAGEIGWAGLLLVLSGVTDYLDGKIARHYGLVTRLGQLLDPIADRLYIAATLLSLAWISVIPWWLVALLVARDALMASMYPVVRHHRLPIPPVHFVGKMATFNLLAAFPLLLFGELEGWWQTPALAAGWALVWWGAALYWVTGCIYLWQLRSMIRQRRAGAGV